MLLSNMKKSEIRCIVSMENGTIVKYYDKKMIENVLKGYDDNTMVKVFSPTIEQQQTISDVIDNTTKGTQVEITGKAFLDLMGLVTDINLDGITDEEALEIINNPNELLTAVNVELNRIFIEVIKKRYETMATLNSLPEPMLKELLTGEIVKAKQTEEEKAKEAERLALEKEQRELEERLAQLKALTK